MAVKQMQIEKTIAALSKGYSPLDYYFKHEDEISEAAVRKLEKKYNLKI